MKRLFRESLKIRFGLWTSVAAMVTLGLTLFAPSSVYAAACASSSLGTATTTLAVANAGTFQVWSRMKADSTTPSNNSYSLEIDGSSCYVVGDNNAISSTTWTWVNYQNGSTSSAIKVTLTAGNHTVKMIGRESGVELDRVIFAADTACVPTDTGNNCAATNTDGSTPSSPSASKTAATAAASSSTPTVTTPGPAPISVAAKGTGYPVTIKVLDSKGKVLGNATVVLSSVTAKTDKDGIVNFADVPAGTYVVTIKSNLGNMSAHITVAPVASKTDTQQFEIRLKPKASVLPIITVVGGGLALVGAGVFLGIRKGWITKKSFKGLLKLVRRSRTALVEPAASVHTEIPAGLSTFGSETPGTVFHPEKKD